MSYRPKIPPLEQVKETINNFPLQQLDLPDRNDISDYVKKLDKLFITEIGLIFRTVLLSNTNNLPAKLYRIRPFDPKMNTGLISEFFAPPPGLCTKLSRANLPFHPAFYCAPSAATALLETLSYAYNQNHENIYFVSEWEFQKDLDIKITPFLFGHYERTGIYNAFKDKALLAFYTNIKGITGEEYQSLKEILSFFSGLFELQSNHVISSYLGHIHLYALDENRTDVFMYPSLKSLKVSLNFALNPNTVINKVRLNRIFAIQVSNFSFDESSATMPLNYSILDLGINNGHSTICWKNLTEQSENQFNQLLMI